MLTLQTIKNHLYVSGLADGSDWLLPRRETHEAGVAGPDRLWTLSGDGKLKIYDVTTRRVLATLPVERKDPIAHRLSRDARHLFLLSNERLYAIDLADARLVAAHGDMPAYASNGLAEAQDHSLLMDHYRHADGEVDLCVTRVDPWSGARDVSAIAMLARSPSGPTNAGFASRSPTGRYWLRFDHTRLSVTGAGADTRFGLTFQIWEAFPLRFVRRVTAVWLPAEQLPDATFISPIGDWRTVHESEAGQQALAQRRAIWTAVAATSDRLAADPLAPFPPRSEFPEPFASDDRHWRAITENWKNLIQDVARNIYWQPDESAFWVETHRLLSCVGIDGTASPRLYSERYGFMPGMVVPLASGFKRVTPLPGRKARLTGLEGEYVFDGAPDPDPARMVAVSADRDQWRPLEPSPAGSMSPDALRKRVAALEAEQRRIVVPLADFELPSVVAAIDKLTRQLTPDLKHRAAERMIEILFQAPGQTMTETGFFNRVAESHPGAAPALRALVERYIAVTGPKDWIFSADRGEAGGQLLAMAVRALGIHDESALPLLEDYGIRVDPGHEYQFAGETTDAIISAHGWTDRVIDHVFFVLLRNFYNTIDDYGYHWHRRGMKAGVRRHAPRTLARHVAERFARFLRGNPGKPALHGSFELDKLAADTQPHQQWEEEFFDELRRLAAARAG